MARNRTETGCRLILHVEKSGLCTQNKGSNGSNSGGGRDIRNLGIVIVWEWRRIK